MGRGVGSFGGGQSRCDQVGRMRGAALKVTGPGVGGNNMGGGVLGLGPPEFLGEVSVSGLYRLFGTSRRIRGGMNVGH